MAGHCRPEGSPSPAPSPHPRHRRGQHHLRDSSGRTVGGANLLAQQIWLEATAQAVQCLQPFQVIADRVKIRWLLSQCIQVIADNSGNKVTTKSMHSTISSNFRYVQTNIQAGPLIGHFLLYNFCSALYLCILALWKYPISGLICKSVGIFSRADPFWSNFYWTRMNIKVSMLGFY